MTDMERQRESATLVDLLNESLIALMRDKDSLMLAARGSWSTSCDCPVSSAV